MKSWIDITWDLLSHSKHVVKSRWSILIIYMSIVACSLIETLAFQFMEVMLIPFYLFIIITVSRLYFLNRLVIDGKFWLGVLWFGVMFLLGVIAVLYLVYFVSPADLETSDVEEASRLIKRTFIVVLAGAWYAILIPAIVMWSILRCGTWDLGKGYAIVFYCRTPGARKALLVMVVFSIACAASSGSDLLMLPVAIAWIDRYVLLNRPKKKARSKQTSLKTAEAL